MTHFHACAHLFCQLLQPKEIKKIQARKEAGNTERQKPTGLVESRGNFETPNRAGFIPHPVIVASHDAEAVFAWPQIAIECRSAPRRILPHPVVPIHFVAKANFLRSPKT